MPHHPHFQFLLSDPEGCFLSNELREWASVRGSGLLTTPGEFLGLTADLENLIRVLKRLARKMAEDHPELMLAFCVSSMFSRQADAHLSNGQWTFWADNGGACGFSCRVKEFSGNVLYQPSFIGKECGIHDTSFLHDVLDDFPFTEFV